MKKPQVEIRADGFSIRFDKSLPSDVRSGHKPYKSGAGIHGKRKQVRVRGNMAKRAWLDSSD